jgi:phosphoglycolate phosphatase-like HAD superfamily hydrolase
MKIVVVDLDDTITDAAWRHALSFDDSLDQSDLDAAFVDVIKFINAVSGIYRIVGVTVRPERYRTATLRWLLEAGVRMDDLLMRRNDDYRREIDLKRDLVTRYINKEMIVCAFDDNEKIIQLYRELGITAFQIYPRRENHDGRRQDDTIST